MAMKHLKGLCIAMGITNSDGCLNKDYADEMDYGIDEAPMDHSIKSLANQHSLHQYASLLLKSLSETARADIIAQLSQDRHC